ncbi:MAG: TIGR01777 family protein [Omnitrophica bacterium RIFCSPLOWO2_12_FULL_50_11]|nr:MAG: TIGR01777 family protein [Omnitrophica bacterium RIFCSPLOWO2_12_FULL_50_11]
MKIVITGATGFIGTPLSGLLICAGHHLTILTRALRRTASRSAHVQHVEWNPADEAGVVARVDGCDAVINLAGENIAARRWTKKQKEKILTSRVSATQCLVRSIQKAGVKPRVLISTSAMGYYGPRGDESLDETAPCGKGFLASTCKAWEAHAVRAEDFGVRVVRLRIGVVLGKGGGALEKMTPPFKCFLGGWLGSGEQWMSWIHLEDVVRLIDACLTNGNLKGPVNVTAPEPVTNKVFSIALAEALNRPCLMPVPSFALKVLFGEMADELLLKGQRVIPRKALDMGFEFRFPEIHGALESIFGVQQ